MGNKGEAKRVVVAYRDGRKTSFAVDPAYDVEAFMLGAASIAKYNPELGVEKISAVDGCWTVLKEWML